MLNFTYDFKNTRFSRKKVDFITFKFLKDSKESNASKKKKKKRKKKKRTQESSNVSINQLMMSCFTTLCAISHALTVFSNSKHVNPHKLFFDMKIICSLVAQL